MRAQSGAQSRFSRGPLPRIHKAKTRLEKAGLHSPVAREAKRFGDHELPRNREFSQAPLACTGKVRPKSAASGRVAPQPGGPMLAFVPVAFDVYRPLKPRLRWAMQCLVSFADHAGRCWPSIRTLAQHAGISKSAAGRDLAELEAEGPLTRPRRPGGIYVYRIDRRFLPRWAPRKLSQTRDCKPVSAPVQVSDRPPGGVPEGGTKEKPD